MTEETCGELVKIRNLVLDDPVALTKWALIVDHVITKPSDVAVIKAKLGGQEPNYAEAILRTLQILSAQHKDVQTVLWPVFKTYGLTTLAGKVQGVQLNERNHESGLNGSPKAGPSSKHDGPAQTDQPYLSPLRISTQLPSRLLNFVERESMLEKLHELVTRPCGKTKSAYALLTSLYGLGGIGKTTLARRYVDYFKEKDRFPHASIFWIESETNSTLRLAFRHLAKSIRVPESENIEIEVLVQMIYERVHNQTCLFVFDNVTEYDGDDGIFHFLPRPNPGPQHFILATSRKADLLSRVDANDRILQLDVLTDTEADQLICKSLPKASPESRRDLFTTLDRLPLALQQAIAYIYHSKGAHPSESCAIEAYLREFQNNAKKLLKSDVLNADGRKNENLKNVYLTWQTTLNTIARQEHGKLAGNPFMGNVLPQS